MKKSIKYFVLLTLIITAFMVLSCAGPGTVSVGVGVGVAGPWVGPAGPRGGPYGRPGGTIWIGRPVTPVYYRINPLQDTGREFVDVRSVDTPVFNAD
jgi:nicotinamide mononucleotide (NMN) deamidase PncC